MQLLSIRKATPAATHAKTGPKLRRPKKQKAKHVLPLRCWKNEQAASSLEAPGHAIAQGAAGPAPLGCAAPAHAASPAAPPPPRRYRARNAHRPAGKKQHQKPQQNAACHTSQPL